MTEIIINSKIRVYTNNLVLVDVFKVTSVVPVYGLIVCALGWWHVFVPVRLVLRYVPFVQVWDHYDGVYNLKGSKADQGDS